MKPMKIEIKRVSINVRLSEETICFSADIWIDGKKAGECSNRGHGGNTDYHLTDRALEARAKDWARLHYLEHGTEEDKRLLGPTGNGWSPDPLEYLIDELVGDYQKAKEEARIAKIEAKQAIGFAKAGLPFMLRIETHAAIVWYGLKSGDPGVVERCKAAATKKHGEIVRATVRPTSPGASS